MGRVILDSTLLIDAERERTDPAAVVSGEDDVAIAAITVAELLHGAERSDERHAWRRDWVERIILHIPVEHYDIRIARAHARLLATSSRPGPGAHDLIIAATAVATGRTVVTRDKRFAQLPGVQVRLVG